MRPQRLQPTSLPRPWDSPGKNTGVGCHFLQCMKVKSESEVTQSCPTLSNPMDCSLTGSSIHGIFQARGAGVACHCLLHYFHILRSKFLNTLLSCNGYLQKYLLSPLPYPERDLSPVIIVICWSHIKQI